MVAESGANARALSAITRRRQRLTSSRGISAWARSISCGGNDLRTAGGGVDLFLLEEVEQCPEHDDRGKLADLVPCGRDGRSENVRGERESFRLTVDFGIPRLDDAAVKLPPRTTRVKTRISRLV